MKNTIILIALLVVLFVPSDVKADGLCQPPITTENCPPPPGHEGDVVAPPFDLEPTFHNPPPGMEDNPVASPIEEPVNLIPPLDYERESRVESFKKSVSFPISLHILHLRERHKIAP